MDKKQDMIYLPDVTFEKLKAEVDYIVEEFNLNGVTVLKDYETNAFLVTFPGGIGNEHFIFFFCGLMAEDTTNSKELRGWFHANDSLTSGSNQGEFGNIYSNPGFSRRILILPDGDDIGNMHQYGVIEDGREIHFGMDGTFEIKVNSSYKYSEPDFDIDDFKLVYSAEKPIDVKVEKKGFFDKLKKLFC